MKFTLTITLGAAMQSPDDVSRALAGVVRLLRDTTEPFEDLNEYNRHGNIRDDNGNRVGEWETR